MHRLIKTLGEYYLCPDFRIFQNSFAREIYESLGTSYSNSEGEVTIVTNLCDRINGKTFEQLTFYAQKIHGPRSFVEFNNQDKPTTKELADMVIISIATQERKIVFEKIAFVQNKKEKPNLAWSIDQDQLYLLHNFPTFSGKKGVFKNFFKDPIVFLDNSKMLGNYGLFLSPGEMILVNASNVYALQQKNNVHLSEIRKLNSAQSGGDCGLHGEPFCGEWHYLVRKYGLPCCHFPFLNSRFLSCNVYDFVRNWSLFNIGEIASVSEMILDKALCVFNRSLLKRFDLAHDLDLQFETNAEYPDFDGNIAVIVSHLNLDEK